MTTTVDLTWLSIERARYESLFDSLTELPRWGLFLDRTAVALERAERSGRGIADRFAAMCCDVASDADAAMIARHLIYDSGLVRGLGIALSTPGDVPDTLVGRALVASAPRDVEPIDAT